MRAQSRFGVPSAGRAFGLRASRRHVDLLRVSSALCRTAAPTGAPSHA